MTCIILPNDNPFFNLAAEEFFLKNPDEDFLLLYINKPSVIVGRHQNLFAEINFSFVKKHHIAYVRRLTGGGTVYHDNGNLNFSFIESGTHGHLANQKKYTDIIVKVLGSFGLDAKPGKRNEITIHEKKISGCAEHIHKNRILHHGTLLFSSDLDNLVQSITPIPGIDGKAVKSIRSTVTNISDHLTDKSKTISVFKKEIIEYLHHSGIIKAIRKPKISETREIEKLERTKFSTWEWNVAYSPQYKIDRTVHLAHGVVQIAATVAGGIINHISLDSKDFPAEIMRKFEQSLEGMKLDETILKDSIADFSKYLDVNVFLENLL